MFFFIGGVYSDLKMMLGWGCVVLGVGIGIEVRSFWVWVGLGFFDGSGRLGKEEGVFSLGVWEIGVYFVVFGGRGVRLCCVFFVFGYF